MRRYALFALLAGGGCGACTSDPGRPDAAGPDATTDAMPDVRDANVVETAPCQPAPRPSYVPAGWVRYDDYAPCSGLYIPTDVSQLPTPVQWQDCEPAAGVSGCKRIKFDWTPATVPNGAYTDADAARDSNGNIIILTSRSISDSNGKIAYNYNIVATSDGTIITALLATQPYQYLPTVYLPPTFQPPRWIFQVIENYGFNSEGYIAGTVNELHPSAHGRYQFGAPWYGVGDLGVLQNNSLLDFTTGSLIANVKGALPMSFDWMFHTHVFWQGNSGRIADIGRWDPDGGAIDFINYNFDPNHAAADFGTDGVDMVWLEAEGPSADTSFWTTADWWTAPYVTEPSKIQRRRLRSESPNAILGVPIAVGCGYAAYMTGPGLRVVRLSDGWSWFLATSWGEGGAGWAYQQALALSCTELFASIAAAGPIYTMARVPLASLGAGVAPD